MNPELARRVAFTLGALLIFRLGSFIPLPGIESSGGKISIFSFNVLPYLSAAIIIQLLSMVSSKLSRRVRAGESGRRAIARYTLVLALVLAAIQAVNVAYGLQRVPGLVGDQDGFFLATTTASLLGGTVFLIWLSEMITLWGVGNGLAVLLCAGIVAALPQTIVSVLEYVRQGALSGNLMLSHAVVWVMLVALIVLVERARRRVPVEFAGREFERRSLAAQSSYLPFKLNSAGLMPTVVAPWLFFLPLTLAAAILGPGSAWLAAAASHIQPGHFGYMILGSIAIFILAFIYTSFVVDPEYAAESLRRNGGAVSGIEPGEATAAHLDCVVSGTTLIGASYLVLVFLIPEAMLAYSNTPHYFGGGSALVVVCTILDLESQVRGFSLTEPGGEMS